MFKQKAPLKQSRFTVAFSRNSTTRIMKDAHHPMSAKAFFGGLRAAINNPPPDILPPQAELDMFIPHYGTKEGRNLAKKLKPETLPAARRSRLRAGDVD